MNTLAVDIGGTHVKFCSERHRVPVKVKSGPKMTPDKMITLIGEHTDQWNFDRVSLGYPGPVIHDKPLMEPQNLGKGWVTFDFKKAFQNKPLRILNDAAMQALGSYRGGRMLFLGLGTGLGSAMVVDGVVQAMELAHMPWKHGKSYESFLGAAALPRDGKKVWRKNVFKVSEQLSQALESEYVILGGGNAALLKHLPRKMMLGSNENAFKGAFMLWQERH